MHDNSLSLNMFKHKLHTVSVTKIIRGCCSFCDLVTFVTFKHNYFLNSLLTYTLTYLLTYMLIKVLQILLLRTTKLLYDITAMSNN